MIRSLPFCLLFTAVASAQEPTLKLLVNSPDEPIAKTMSLAKTAEFLDHQSRAWTHVKKCGTCHTNYPYLLSRGSLGGDLAALQEVRGFFEKRIMGWESGRKEDRPRRDTEVIATAATLALQDAFGSGKLHPLTRKALDRMWTLQQPNGAWDWLKCGWPPLEHDDYYGVVYVTVAVGHAPDQYAETEQARAGLDKFRKFFKNNPAPSLHHKAMLLWAAQKVTGIMSETLKKSTIAELRATLRACRRSATGSAATNGRTIAPPRATAMRRAWSSTSCAKRVCRRWMNRCGAASAGSGATSANRGAGSRSRSTRTATTSSPTPAPPMRFSP